MIEVGKIYQVKVNNKYWFRGEVVTIRDNKATVVVPTYYSNQYNEFVVTIRDNKATIVEPTYYSNQYNVFVVTVDLNELREVEVDLTKKDNKYRK